MGSESGVLDFCQSVLGQDGYFCEMGKTTLVDIQP